MEVNTDRDSYSCCIVWSERVMTTDYCCPSSGTSQPGCPKGPVFGISISLPGHFCVEMLVDGTISTV